MIFLGIDPGVNGAVAVIDGDTITLHDVPAYAGKKGQKMNDGEMAMMLAEFNQNLTWPKPTFCVLEDIFTKPGESNNSALTIGRHWGLWKGILSAYCIPHQVVPATVWNREFRILGDEKEMSRHRAMELFPQMRDKLKRGTARVDFSEALLMAEYARRLKVGGLRK